MDLRIKGFESVDDAPQFADFEAHAFIVEIGQRHHVRCFFRVSDQKSKSRVLGKLFLRQGDNVYGGCPGKKKRSVLDFLNGQGKEYWQQVVNNFFDMAYFGDQDDDSDEMLLNHLHCIKKVKMG